MITPQFLISIADVKTSFLIFLCNLPTIIQKSSELIVRLKMENWKFSKWKKKLIQVDFSYFPASDEEKVINLNLTHMTIIFLFFWFKLSSEWNHQLSWKSCIVSECGEANEWRHLILTTMMNNSWRSLNVVSRDLK